MRLLLNILLLFICSNVVAQKVKIKNDLYVFDLRGKVKSLETGNDSIRNITFYNKEGFMTSRTRYVGGKQVEQYLYYYHQSRLKKVVKIKDGIKKDFILRRYDARGRLKEEVMTIDWTTMDGNYDHSTITTTVFISNEKGEHIQSDVTTSDGKQYSLYYSRTPLEFTCTHSIDGLQSITRYDSLGYVSEQIYYHKGKESSHIIYKRNAENHEVMSEMVLRGADWEEIFVTQREYIYDEQRNWIRSECLVNGQPIIEVRKITYYK